MPNTEREVAERIFRALQVPNAAGSSWDKIAAIYTFDDIPKVAGIIATALTTARQQQREVLEKYLALIIDREGTDYLSPDSAAEFNEFGYGVTFTDEEYRELKEASARAAIRAEGEGGNG